MTIAASYLSTSIFTVDGNHAADWPAGFRVKLIQGVDGSAKATVDSATYNGGTLKTEVTLTSPVVTANLEEVLRGVGGDENLWNHTHESEEEGGLIPATELSEAEVDLAHEVFALGQATAGALIGIDSDGGDYALWSLAGTSNQVTLTPAAGTITFSTPQNIHSAATPTFAGLTLSGLTGALFGNAGSALSALASGTALQMLRRNALNNAYEWAVPSLGNFSDVDPTVSTAAVQGDMLLRGASKWELIVKPTDVEYFLGADPVTRVPVWRAPDFKNLSDVDPDVSDTPEEGDILTYDGDKWNRLIKPTDIDYFLGANEYTRNPEWKAPPGATDLADLSDVDPDVSTAADGDILVYSSGKWNLLVKPTDADYFLGADAGTLEPAWKLPPGAGGGEANTGSNVGAGVGVFKQKNGLDLEFKSLSASQFETSGASEVQIKESVLGGGGGASRDAFASRPAAGTQGRIFLPTDGHYPSYDNGASWECLAVPGFQVTNPPLAASLTQVTGGGDGTLTADYGDGLLLTQSGTGTTSVRAAVYLIGTLPTEPTTAYTWTVGFELTRFYKLNYRFLGICLMAGNDTNADYVHFSISVTTSAPYFGLSLQYFTAINTWSANYSGVAIDHVSPHIPLFLRLEDDTTNRIWSFSNDGVHFQTLLSHGRTTGCTPTYYGFYSQASNSSLSSGYVGAEINIFHSLLDLP